MELKRRNTPDGMRVEVIHTGTSEPQNWSSGHLMKWMEEGWVTVEDKRVVLHTIDSQPDLVYAIKRKPGYYCNQTGESIPISDLAMTQFMTQTVATRAPAEARAWLAAKGRAGGYDATRNYECVLDSKQHAKFKKGA